MGRRGRSFYISILASASVGMASTGCSPAGWFGPDGDPEVLRQRPAATRSNSRCSGVDLSRADLDVPTFRKLVSCFNSNGTLEPIERLTLRATDAQLQPLMAMVNETLLNNPTLLFDLRTTYGEWVGRQMLDTAFSKLGVVLENEDFVASAVVLLKGAYEAIDDRSLLLEGIAKLSTKIQANSVRGAMDGIISLAESRVARALLEEIRMDRPGARVLRALTDGVWAYAQETRPEDLKNLLTRAVRAAAEGKLFSALDLGLGTSDAELQNSIPELAAAFHSILGENGRLTSEVATLFGLIRRPIPCLHGARSVQDPASFVIGEMHLRYRDRPEEFLWRQNPLALVALNSFCDYPAGLDQAYGAMRELSIQPGFRRMAGFLGGFYDQGLVSLLAGFLGDTGPAGTSGVKLLIPYLAEGRDRGMLGDALLAVALLRPEDRQAVQNVAAFLVEPIRATGGPNLVEVVAQGVSGVSRQNLYELIRSLTRFAENDEQLISPALRGLRSAMFVNNVHPVLNLVQSLLERAPRSEALFETVFFLAVQPEFRDSVRLVSQLAKDGRLRELVGGVLELFSGVGERGRHEGIVPVSEPPFVRLARHDWRASDSFFVEHTPAQGRTPLVTEACTRMMFGLPLSDTEAARAGEQLDSLLGCLDQNREYSDVVRFVRYLRCDRTALPGQPCAGRTLRGRDYYRLTLDLIRGLDFGADNLADLTDRFLGAVRDGRVDRATRSASLPLGRDYLGGTLARAAADLLSPVFGAIRAPFQRVLDFGAQLIVRNDLHLGVQLIDRLRKREPERVSRVPEVHFDDARLGLRIRNKECPENLRAVPTRIAEARSGFLNGISNWEWVDGHERRAWDFDEFKELLAPVVAKLGDPAQGHPERPVADALTNTLKYFSLRPGEARSRSKQWRPEELATFLQDRSNDVQMITYFYPGETVPRVRLVNSLDRLELILTNADLQFLLPYNFGMRFLARLGMAWGDEPRELWPEPIQRMYAPGNRPPTLREAYGRIIASLQQLERLMGYPYRPECEQEPDPTDRNLEWTAGTGMSRRIPLYVKASIFNIRQVIAVAEENLPDAGGPNRGGMKVLRNLFYELYASNPDDVFSERYINYWSTAGLRNNLSLVIRFVKAGLIRQVGRQIRQWPNLNLNVGSLTPEQRLERESLLDLFRSLIEAASLPGTADLVRDLVAAAPDQELIWNVIRRVFEVLDDPDQSKAQHMRQAVYYLVANLKTLGVTSEALRTLRPVLRNHGTYLKANADLLVDLVANPQASNFLRAFFEDDGKAPELPAVQGLLRQVFSQPDRAEDLVRVLEQIDGNQTSKTAWDLLMDRSERMTQSTEYKNIQLGDVWDSLFSYLSQAPATPAGRSALRLREYAAGRMRADSSGVSDALDLAALLARSPEEFDRLARALSRSIDRGEISDLTGMVERALSVATSP